jgi:hypothetical protein
MTAPAGVRKLNFGGFIQHYRPMGWLIRGSTGPSGFVAVHLDENGRPTRGSARSRTR